MERTLLQKFQIWLIETFARIRIKQRRKLDDIDFDIIKAMFETDYFIIATKRSNHFSTFMINFGHFFLTGRWGTYSHVLMNLEDEVKSDDDFRFIEATGRGTHYSTFEEVFHGVDAIALIKPKNMGLIEWTEALDRAKTFLGRPYDNLLDLRNDLEINCVELIRLALEGIPDYEVKFAEFEKLVAKKKKLTPSMFLECSDFEVVWSVKR